MMSSKRIGALVVTMFAVSTCLAMSIPIVQAYEPPEVLSSTYRQYGTYIFTPLVNCWLQGTLEVTVRRSSFTYQYWYDGNLFFGCLWETSPHAELYWDVDGKTLHVSAVACYQYYDENQQLYIPLYDYLDVYIHFNQATHAFTAWGESEPFG